MRLSLKKLITKLKENNYKIKRIYCKKDECRYITISHNDDVYDTQFTIAIESPYIIECIEHSAKVQIKERESYKLHIKQWKNLKNNITDKTLFFLSEDIFSIVYPEGKADSYTICNEYNSSEEDDDDKSEEKDNKEDTEGIELVEKANDIMIGIQRHKNKKKRKGCAKIIFEDEHGKPIKVDKKLLSELGKENDKDEITLIDDIESYDDEDGENENLNNNKSAMMCHIVFTLEYLHKKISTIYTNVRRFHKKIEYIERSKRSAEIKEIQEDIGGIAHSINKNYQSFKKRLTRYDEKIKELEEVIQKINGLLSEEELSLKQIKKLQAIKTEAKKSVKDVYEKRVSLFYELDDNTNKTRSAINSLLKIYS